MVCSVMETECFTNLRPLYAACNFDIDFGKHQVMKCMCMIIATTHDATPCTHNFKACMHAERPRPLQSFIITACFFASLAVSPPSPVQGQCINATIASMSSAVNTACTNINAMPSNRQEVQ